MTPFLRRKNYSPACKSYGLEEEPETTKGMKIWMLKTEGLQKI